MRRAVIAIVIISVLGGVVQWTRHQNALRQARINYLVIRVNETRDLYRSQIYGAFTDYFSKNQRFASQESDMWADDSGFSGFWLNKGFHSVTVKGGGQTIFTFHIGNVPPLYEVTLTMSWNEKSATFSLNCTSRNIPPEAIEKLQEPCPSA